MDGHGLVCRAVLEQPDITQRELAAELNVSLGIANGFAKERVDRGYIVERTEGKDGFRYGSKWELKEEGRRLLEQYKVDDMLTIVAGLGSRFVPLTFKTPKGLLEVFGERMIERQICQFHEVGIKDTTIAVGYLREKFEYLIDRYDMEPLYNPEYSGKSTLVTICRAGRVLKGRNMYVLSSDNWMRESMYHAYECGTWYSAVFQKGETKEWCLSFNKKGRIMDVKVGGRDQWVMYGPTYLSREFISRFMPVLEAYYKIPGTEQFYWEQVYVDVLTGEAKRHLEWENQEIPKQVIKESALPTGYRSEIEMDANRQPEDQVYESENLEELRLFDPRYQNHSDNAAMGPVAEVFQVPESQTRDICCLKSGMTSKSFLLKVGEYHCICRIPGSGAELLINRRQEEQVYDAVALPGVTEHVIYMNERIGYKVAEYYEGARNAAADSWSGMGQYVGIVRCLHRSGIEVGHEFDTQERIDFYEKLCRSRGAVLFEDYEEVQGWMDWIMDSLEAMKRTKYLCHIDANVDNFLLLKDGSVKLLDWEYTGICDPIMDISMSATYPYYNGEDMEHPLKLYFQREPEPEELSAIYRYAAPGNFLWNLWAVHKSAPGDESGEYAIIIYRYAKKYYRKLQKL